MIIGILEKSLVDNNVQTQCAWGRQGISPSAAQGAQKPNLTYGKALPMWEMSHLKSTDFD